MLGTSIILISLVTGVSVVFVSFFNFLRDKSKTNVLMQHVNAGHPLSDELIKSLQGTPAQASMPDIRKAILLISLGIAGTIFSQFLDNPSDMQLAQGLSLFPIVLGIGYIVSLQIEKRLG